MSPCVTIFIFKDTDQPLVPMPASYYTLASDRIAIPKRANNGGSRSAVDG